MFRFYFVMFGMTTAQNYLMGHVETGYMDDFGNLVSVITHINQTALSYKD